MSNKNKISEFLTPDISYLLGLITGRGTIQYSNDVKRISIDFEYKSLKTKAIKKIFDQRLHIQTSLDPIVYRLQQMGIEVRKVVQGKQLSIVLYWLNEDISWLFIKFLINGTRFSYHDFGVPEPIYKTTNDNKKEYIRGISDVTGYVRNSNRDRIGKHRVYIEISNRNWLLPPQICELVQSLNIPIQNINYGHPNLRGGRGTSWAKEHQMKIYADNFQEIGFYISHKNEALEELAEYNKNNFNSILTLCNGEIYRRKSKKSHEHENHEKLPEIIRGHHFNSYKEICDCFGCYQQRKNNDV